MAREWLASDSCVAFVWLVCGLCVACVWLLCGLCVAFVWLVLRDFFLRFMPMSDYPLISRPENGLPHYLEATLLS